MKPQEAKEAQEAFADFKAACGDSKRKVRIWDQVVKECVDVGLPADRKKIRSEIATGFLDDAKYQPGSVKPYREHKGQPPVPDVRTYNWQYQLGKNGYFQIMLDDQVWVLKTLRASGAKAKATLAESSKLAQQFLELKKILEKKE